MKDASNFTAQDIVEDAISAINKLDSDVTFKLKDLFKGVDWDSFPKNERLSAGTTFRNLVASGKLSVLNTGKTSSNSALYQKKEKRIRSF